MFRIYCTQCGTALSPTANFCRKCGTKVRKNRSGFLKPIDTNQMLLKAREKVKDFSQPKIDQSRDFVAEKLDNLTETVKSPEKLTQLSSNQKDYLAQRLASIRNKIAREQQTSGSANFEPTMEEALEIVEINEELMKQLIDEKCLICYKGMLDPDHHEELVLCPQCGHGGHRSHIFSWFQTNKSCPYCKGQITTEQVLILPPPNNN